MYNSANQANFELHGYFSAEKFLVLAPSSSQGNSKLLALLELDKSADEFLNGF